ncbi:NAD-dependent succinate-semialdehyde dehydrogenase [[Eubacterium] cellulosolvens]
MKFKTINPATEEVNAEYETMSREEVMDIVKECNFAFQSWKKIPIQERIGHIPNLAGELRANIDEFARLITVEMGKPIKESKAEVEKCAWTAEVYAENAEAWLAEEAVDADGKAHRVLYQPLGVILSIMPWNFPFWQALRFAIPTLIAGNVSILKHSNTVPECALAIEKLFMTAGFPENVFRTVLADHGTVAELMASDIIRGVSFTGSTEAGTRIAEQAGKYLKKVVLELGGSDPFIVLEDADIELAAKNAVLGRTISTGQSCIAAKRFIIHEGIAEEFSKRFAELMAELPLGDPLDDRTKIGPLVTAEALQKVEGQVEDAVNKGAIILAGGKRIGDKGYFYAPTVLTNTTSTMKVVTEEVFAPVAPVIVVKDEAEAIKVANSSEFGLGGSVWTSDLKRGERLAREIEAGAVFVNNITKSDPRMPFGGIKKSGIGRELSKFSLKEFVNIKGLNIYEHE